MMIQISLQQSEVFKRFNKLAQQIIDPAAAYHDAYWLVGDDPRKVPSRGISRDLSNISPEQPGFYKHLSHTPSWASAMMSSRSSLKHQNAKNRREQYEFFSARARNLLEDVIDRTEELRSLRRSANSTADNVSNRRALLERPTSSNSSHHAHAFSTACC